MSILLKVGQDGVVRRRLEKAEIAGEQEKVLQLARGAEGNVKEPDKIGIARPAAALGDVGWNRGRGTAHLAANPVSHSENASEVSYMDNATARLAADLEVAKDLHDPK